MNKTPNKSVSLTIPQQYKSKELTEKEQHTYSLQYQTNDKTAPAFIAVAADDSAVNPGNSLIYALAIIAPVVLPNPYHGLRYTTVFPLPYLRIIPSARNRFKSATA